MVTKGSKPESLTLDFHQKMASTKERKNSSLGRKSFREVSISLSLLLSCSLEIQAQLFTLLFTYGSFSLWFNIL